jgi:hypothetical protein
MCGATDDQKEISDSQQQMYKTLNDNYTTVFGQAQDILKTLTSSFTPILNAGPMQEGMTPEQKTALNTAQFENINAQSAAAQRAVAQSLAARGGGNTVLPSSVSTNALNAPITAAATARAAAANNTINQSYALGRQNWQQAINVLSGTAGLLNPTGYSSTAISGGNAAANTANQIAQANNSIWNGVIGAIGSVGGAALGNVGSISNLFNKAPSLPYQQWYNNPQATISSAPLTSTIPSIPMPSYA